MNSEVINRKRSNPKKEVPRMIYGLIVKFNWTLDYVLNLRYPQAQELYELIRWENKQIEKQRKKKK